MEPWQLWVFSTSPLAVWIKTYVKCTLFKFIPTASLRVLLHHLFSKKTTCLADSHKQAWKKKKQFPFQKATLWGPKSCEVAIIWPEQCQNPTDPIHLPPRPKRHPLLPTHGCKPVPHAQRPLQAFSSSSIRNLSGSFCWSVGDIEGLKGWSQII